MFCLIMRPTFEILKFTIPHPIKNSSQSKFGKPNFNKNEKQFEVQRFYFFAEEKLYEKKVEKKRKKLPINSNFESEK